MPSVSSVFLFPLRSVVRAEEGRAGQGRGQGCDLGAARTFLPSTELGPCPSLLSPVPPDSTEGQG